MLAAPPELPRVFHDQRSGLGPLPLEESVRFLSFIEDDEQSRARRASVWSSTRGVKNQAMRAAVSVRVKVP